MSTPESVMGQMKKLLDDANETTGYRDGTLTIAVNRLIAGYGIPTVCNHTNTKEANYVNDDWANRHNFHVVCADCGAVLDASCMGGHVDDDGDGICDLCDGCIHDMVSQFTGLGDGTHTEKEVCTKCGYTKEWDDILKCEDKDGDGKCDKCGADMACTHAEYLWVLKSNGDGTHTRTKKCRSCGEVLETEVTACTDSNGDGKCDVCGGAVQTVCTHASTSSGWTPNGDGTHVYKVVCRACGEIVAETTELCTDTDGDGKCDVCGGQLDTGVWSYAAGELHGILGEKLQIGTYDQLTFVYSSRYVCVGAATGEAEDKIQTSQFAIPIPALATSLTLKLDNSKVTGMTMLFFKGSVSQTTDYDEIEGYPSNGVVKQVFNAGAWDYVVFNLEHRDIGYYVDKDELVFE